MRLFAPPFAFGGWVLPIPWLAAAKEVEKKRAQAAVRDCVRAMQAAFLEDPDVVFSETVFQELMEYDQHYGLGEVGDVFALLVCEVKVERDLDRSDLRSWIGSYVPYFFSKYRENVEANIACLRQLPPEWDRADVPHPSLLGLRPERASRALLKELVARSADAFLYDDLSRFAKSCVESMDLPYREQEEARVAALARKRIPFWHERALAAPRVFLERTCPVCWSEFEAGRIVCLHICGHTVCRSCYSALVHRHRRKEVKCPLCMRTAQCVTYLPEDECDLLCYEVLDEPFIMLQR